ncbi:MAG: LysR substrate-binding domain-containing protein [Pseudomonadota bacterium]
MKSLRSTLPPLDALVTFEAAARLGGFTRAAEELNVTPSAVSQQIRSLEERLGLGLFERGHRSVRLTAAGRQLENSVTVALDHLRAASDRVRASAQDEPVTLAVDQSIAQLWLPARLAAFRSAAGDAPIRVTASDQFEALLDVTHDLAIIHGDGRWDGYDAHMLIPERVFPVASPAFCDANPQVEQPDGLSHADLIEFEYQGWAWMNWTIFASNLGLAAPDSRRVVWTNSYPLAIDAARRGMGVALGWDGLLDQDLSAGTLVRLTDKTARTERGYHVIWRHNARLSERADKLRAALCTDPPRCQP